MNRYNQEQKQAYFANLRRRWQEAKRLSENDQELKAVYLEAAKTASGKVSFISFFLVSQDLKAAGLEGIPYVDAKTYQGWKTSGYQVKKGEKAVSQGIVWLRPKVTKVVDDVEVLEEEEGAIYPKGYALFHRSQVEPIAA